MTVPGPPAEVSLDHALALAAAEIEAGRLDRADHILGQILGVAPDYPEALHLVGVVAYRAGQHQAALAWFGRVVDRAPDHADAWHNLAQTRLRLGQPGAALEPLRRAVALRPERAEWHRRLGDLLHAGGALGEAIGCYRRAVELDDRLVEAWYALGCALAARREHPAAIAAFERCLGLEPDRAEAAYNLGQALFELGRVEDALDRFREAAASSDPAIREPALRALATVLPGDPRADNAAVLAARRGWAALALPPAPPRPPARPRQPDRPARVGYLSSFFHRTNWMKPVWGLIDRHDRARFEIHLFSDAPAARIEHGYRPHPADRFHDLSGLDNPAAAGLIRDQGLDLLIDLNGFSAVERVALLALRPAPRIAGWFNCYATTGLDTVDALIGDRWVIPAAEEPFYSERILRLPDHSCLTFAIHYPVPPVTPPPCLAEGRVTFGCLAPQYKITPGMVAVLAAILHRCPGSMLVLRNTALDTEVSRAFVRARFEALGIPQDRINPLGPAEHFRFLETYAAIDIAIDTFPYNGGQTTTEALWQGVPFLTVAGDRWAGRTSASILHAAGLGEWVAPDAAGLIARAAALATAPDAAARLAGLRRTLRDRLAAAPVCDTAGFARAMEAIYDRLLDPVAGPSGGQ